MKILLCLAVLLVSVTLLQTQVEAAVAVELVQPNPGENKIIKINSFYTKQNIKHGTYKIFYTVSQIDVYTLLNVISQQWNEIKYHLCCVLFLKLSQVRTRSKCPPSATYTPNNDVEQSDIPSGLLLMEYQWWHIQNSMNSGFLDTNLTRTLPQWFLWGSVQQPALLHQHSHYQWNFSFFRTDLSTYLVPFHRLQLVLNSCYCYPCWWWCTKFNPTRSLNFNNILHFPITLQ